MSFYVLAGLAGLAAAIPLTVLEAWPLELIVSFRLQIRVLLVLVALLAVVGEIARFDPDVVVVAEATPVWADALAKLSPLYHHIIAAPREHKFGMVLLSRLPLIGDDSQWVEALPVPPNYQAEPPAAIMAQVETDAGSIAIAGMHPFPPLTGSFYAIRNAQLDVLVQMVANETRPVIAVGDLNAVPWSPTFRRFLDQSGLGGPNIVPTWPSVLGLAGLPIDHVLLSRDLDMQTIKRGSDHLPLFAVIVVGAAQGSPGTP